MLADIALENLGVIPSASAEFSSGLTVLTGETGAGKTMVVTGLRLLCGGRADASRVRSGAKQAVVEGRFLVDGISAETNKRVVDIVQNAGGIPDENGDFLAVRSISSAGRSKAHLGGRSVPAATLAEFSSELLTVHGQNDQLRLLAPERQLEALDRFIPELSQLRRSYSELFSRWKRLEKDLTERVSKRRELAQEVDRLQFAIAEIDALAPIPREDVELVVQIRRLQDVDSLREQATVALSAIDGAEALGEFISVEAEIGTEQESASHQLGRAESALHSSEDPQLRELAKSLSEITSQISGVSMELGAFLSDLPADPQQLEQLLSRQQELKSLTRKYAADIDGVIMWREKAQAKLTSIDVSTEAIDAIRQEAAKSQATMLRAAKKLSQARNKAAKILGAAVTGELHGLAMANSRFVVSLSTVDPTSSGIDVVEFQLAGSGESAPRSLATSASGGELSRVMLALEVILAASATGTTLVFDEVDAGVGGRAAVEIGRRLAKLSIQNQVIVVTHLPQVAAYADTHLHIAKDLGGGSAASFVESLNEPRRIEELARMLAGLDDTETGRAHAHELLERAQREREEFSLAKSGAQFTSG